MSGDRRGLRKTASSIFFACACAAPFSRMERRLPSICTKTGTDARNIEIDMNFLGVRERHYNDARAGAMSRAAASKVDYGRVARDAPGSAIKRAESSPL